MEPQCQSIVVAAIYTRTCPDGRPKDKLTLMEKSAQLAYKAGGECLDEETGEVVVPAIYVPNKESITVKFLAADEPEFNEPPY